MDEKVAAGLNIVLRRRERGMSQEALALAVGLTRGYLSGLERGRRNGTVDTLAAIARVLDVRLRDLFQDVPPEVARAVQSTSPPSRRRSTHRVRHRSADRPKT